MDFTPVDIETEEDDCVQKVEYSLDEDEIVRLISRKTETYDIPAKLSVSELKNIGKSDSAAQFKKPRFLQGGVTGADRGSATHKFLQFCDFLKVCTKEGFEQEKQRLVSYEFITKADADLVDGEGIIRFVNTDRMRSLITNYNMRKEVEPHYHIIETAVKAMEEAGIEVDIRPIRGGTDGARLSFMGLPCPNIFAGGHNFHGKFEYVPVESMEKATEVILNILKIYAQ